MPPKKRQTKSKRKDDYDDSLLPDDFNEMINAEDESEFMRWQKEAMLEIQAQNSKSTKGTRKSTRSSKENADECIIIDEEATSKKLSSSLTSKLSTSLSSNKEASKSSVDCDFGNSPNSSLEHEKIDTDKLLNDLDRDLSVENKQDKGKKLVENQTVKLDSDDESTISLNRSFNEDDKKSTKESSKESKKESSKESKKESSKESKKESKKESSKEKNKETTKQAKNSETVNVDKKSKEDVIIIDKEEDAKKSRPARQKRTVEPIEAPLNKRRKCRGNEPNPLQFIANPVNLPSLGIKIGLSRRSNVRKSLHPELFKEK